MANKWVILAASAAMAFGAGAAQAATFDFSFTAPVVQWGDPGDTYLGQGQLFADDEGGGVFTVTGARGTATIQDYAPWSASITGGEGTLTLGANGFTADGLALFGSGYYGFALNPDTSPTTYTIFLGEVAAPEGTLTITPGVASVPEPATWAMMIAGFGATGVAMRKRRKAAVRFG